MGMKNKIDNEEKLRKILLTIIISLGIVIIGLAAVVVIALINLKTKKESEIADSFFKLHTDYTE